ncbi:uncharacterized protein LOC662932 [Tribolium castaneum]|nr:PREDICTED: uncharacterized protein LOC662932 [Tribolium castaneum]|eukprot:XP_974094.3 PREDICTED: uncharacterized protein LOC662932 [Tribolium castaneum]
MSAEQCLPINSAVSRSLSSGIISCFLTMLFFNTIEWTNGLRLKNMNVPLVADFRQEMDLDCNFDMGGEDLYAVKWYKDDQEFFRYMPSRQPHTMSFPVPGVHLVLDGTNCSLVHCKVRLRDLTRDHSGGAYRCEVSSEAPFFRLAAATHNVTVAALPRENPRIEGLTTSYMEGDTVEAKCVSDPADPTPILSWYINGVEAPAKSIGEMTSSEPDGSGLVSRSLSLSFVAERKHSRGDSIELRCMSSLPGVPLSPQETTLKIPVRVPDAQVINNQKLHWFNSPTPATANTPKAAWMLVVASVVRWGLTAFGDDVR